MILPTLPLIPAALFRLTMPNAFRQNDPHFMRSVNRSDEKRGEADLKSPREERTSRSIQSIEIGFQILRAIEEKSKPLTLGEIARAVDMPGGSVHPYLVGLSKVGIVRQEAATGRYGLGPYAVQLGLAGIRQLDVFEASKPILSDLRDETGLSIYLSVWGNRGPAIIHRLDGALDAPVAVSVGWVLPILWTAMGQVCLTYLPRAVTRKQVMAERQSQAAFAEMTDAEFEDVIDKKIETVLKHGLATTDSQIAEGYAAIAAPICDHKGALLAVVTVIGLHATLQPQPDSPNAQRLKAAAKSISLAMGYQPQEP